MTGLPMTVISGYLGAGKTTLINRLLAADHGLKLMILVNDFGAVNIDEGLLASKDEDTIALTNGCVCCTMGADLFLALADALDRSPRPDHLIVEASGVSDPARIAKADLAEPALRYAGIVTVVDGPQYEGLGADPLIGPQVRDQVKKADLIVVTKMTGDTQVPGLAEHARVEVLDADDTRSLVELVLADPSAAPLLSSDMPHPSYVGWSCRIPTGIDLEVLRAGLTRRPAGLFRVKGSVADPSGAIWDVKVVGRQIEITPATDARDTTLVGIGLSERVSTDEIGHWWSRMSLPA